MRAQCANAASTSRVFASGVRNPECADNVTLASVVSTCPDGSGSTAKTSRPAWPICPEHNASTIAASSTSAPRAVLTSRTPRRIADWMIARTYRAMDRIDDAIALQLELERAWNADGEPDPYVYEELALLFRAKGDEQRAAHYETLRRAAAK